MSATPGPWHAEFSKDSGYDCMTDAFHVQSETKLIVTIDCGSYGQRPCKPLSDESRALAEANARLIAAAPELLAALKELLDEAKDLAFTVDHEFRVGNEPSSCEAPEFKAAEAAIAKAEA